MFERRGSHGHVLLKCACLYRFYFQVGVISPGGIGVGLLSRLRPAVQSVARLRPCKVQAERIAQDVLVGLGSARGQPVIVGPALADAGQFVTGCPPPRHSPARPELSRGPGPAAGRSAARSGACSPR